MSRQTKLLFKAYRRERREKLARAAYSKEVRRINNIFTTKLIPNKNKQPINMSSLVCRAEFHIDKVNVKGCMLHACVKVAMPKYVASITI